MTKFWSAKGKDLNVPAAHPYLTLHSSARRVSRLLTFYYASLNEG